MADIICPHCGMLIPVTGSGSKTIVKVPGRAQSKLPKDPEAPKKVGLKDILGERFDDYWKVANLFGKAKNFAPTYSASAYMEHVAAGAQPQQILIEATRLVRLTSEPKYLPQFLKWLRGQDFLTPVPPPGESEHGHGPNSQQNSRLFSRRSAE